MLNLLKRLWKDESALSATEYGVIAAVIGGAVIGAIYTLRGRITAIFTRAETGLARQN